jgi:chromosome segregation ATPase
MDNQDKDALIARLTAENEALVAANEQLRTDLRTQQSKNYMAKQFVEETQAQLMQLHVQATRRVAQSETKTAPGSFPGMVCEQKDTRWDIS